MALTEAQLLNQIKVQAECLWEIAYKIVRGECTRKDLREGKKCYAELQAHIAEYFERRCHREDSLVWFAMAVTDAFQECYAKTKSR